MSHNPLITIVTPSYNQGQFIEETILSILNQTYKNIQYIIVDGGSTDQTMEVVNKYKDQIDIIIHEKDNGQSDAINKGFKLAKGELVGWINSDDILYANCVENIVKLYLENKSGAIFYCSKLDLINKASGIINTVTVNIPNRNYLLKENYNLIQQGSFYNYEIIKKVGFLNESIHYCMDLELWLRLLHFGSIHKLNDKVYSAFRIWEETKSSTGGSLFLENISKVLLDNGGSVFSANFIRIKWYLLKIIIKNFLN